MEKVAVLGAGSWGTALALSLAKKGHHVSLWGRDSAKMTAMNKTRENLSYLPGVVLPSGIKATADLEEALAKKKYLVLAVPSCQIRAICQKTRDLIREEMIIINVAKGIEQGTQGTLKRMSEVIGEEYREKAPAVCVLSGPSHAEEVGRDIPTAVVVGSISRKTAEEVQELFMSPKFRVYTNPDLIGIEIGGALKNVIALGTGIADGIGFGDNTKAALMTRGVKEIARVGVAAGANPLTFAGLSGIGDLIVTCTSMHSRNRRAGIRLGQGEPLAQVLSEIGMVVEGVTATKAGCALSKKYQVKMPICQETYEVLFNNKDPKEAVVDLMMRQKTHEVEDVVELAEW